MVEERGGDCSVEEDEGKGGEVGCDARFVQPRYGGDVRGGCLFCAATFLGKVSRYLSPML